MMKFAHQPPDVPVQHVRLEKGHNCSYHIKDKKFLAMLLLKFPAVAKYLKSTRVPSKRDYHSPILTKPGIGSLAGLHHNQLLVSR